MLLTCVTQLPEAVGQLQTLPEQFEALRAAVHHAGQCGLTGGKVVHETRGSAPQPGANAMAHPQVEQHIAIGFVGKGFGLGQGFQRID